jgi:Succinate dehydrogenase/fumarate reductase, flavoprotein subunit
MQGLADGYFVIPYTVGDYLADDILSGPVNTDSEAFAEAQKEVESNIQKLLNAPGKKHSVDYYHKKLGKIMWDKCGMSRNEQGLKEAIQEIQALRSEYWENVNVPGQDREMNPELDKALRVSDFMELGELMCLDALTREESAGGHFREEYQTEEGEALRRDEDFAFVSVWEFTSEPSQAQLHKEDLLFENVELKTRSYK